jgi:hypothetical protein
MAIKMSDPVKRGSRRFSWSPKGRLATANLCSILCLGLALGSTATSLAAAGMGQDGQSGVRSLGGVETASSAGHQDGWSVGTIEVLSSALPDRDHDGVPDELDNCLDVPNGANGPGESQRDTDGDGFGNACDTDLNNDSIANFADLAIFQQAFAATEGDEAFETNADFDGDGTVGLDDYSVFQQSWLLAPGPSGVR